MNIPCSADLIVISLIIGNLLELVEHEDSGGGVYTASHPPWRSPAVPAVQLHREHAGHGRATLHISPGT